MPAARARRAAAQLLSLPDLALVPRVPLSAMLEPFAPRCLPRRLQPVTCSLQTHDKNKMARSANEQARHRARLPMASCIARRSTVCTHVRAQTLCATSVAIICSSLPGRSASYAVPAPRSSTANRKRRRRRRPPIQLRFDFMQTPGNASTGASNPRSPQPQHVACLPPCLYASYLQHTPHPCRAVSHRAAQHITQRSPLNPPRLLRRSTCFGTRPHQATAA